LNQLYVKSPALWQADYDHAGFFWVDCNDRENSVLSFVRQSADGSNPMAVIMNLTPVPRAGYRIGLPRGGRWREVLNSDSLIYGGSNQGNYGGVTTENRACHNQQQSATFNLPPLSVTVFQHENA
jgi:1,4-alpha-glucan branching enzyme